MARISFPMTAAAILFVATSVLATFVVAIPLGVRADEEQRAVRPENAEVPETDAKGGAEDASGRILHFPRDRSLGRLWVYESDTDLAQLDEHACIEARGDVDVPAGKRAGLQYVDPRIKNLAADQPWGLSPLDDLRPTDLDFLMFVFARLPTDELKRLTRHTSLRMLSISVSEMNEDGLASVGKISSLEELTFGEIKISDKGLAHLKDLHNLRTLHLGSGGITNEGLPHLAKLNKLEELDLTWASITDAGLPHLAHLENMKHLQLGRTTISGPGLVHLAGMKSLQQLDLTDTQVGDESLAHLKPFQVLQRLNLTGTLVGDDGLKHLASLTALEHLDLYGARVGDDGLKHLAALKMLQRLGLGKTRVGDAGLAHLQSLVKLERLDLTDTQVTDQGLAHLKTLRNLHSLNLSRTKVTEAGVAALRKQLPETTVLSDFAAQSQARNEEPAQDVMSAMSPGGADEHSGDLEARRAGLPAAQREVLYERPVTEAEKQAERIGNSDFYYQKPVTLADIRRSYRTQKLPEDIFKVEMIVDNKQNAGRPIIRLYSVSRGWVDQDAHKKWHDEAEKRLPLQRPDNSSRLIETELRLLDVTLGIYYPPTKEIGFMKQVFEAPGGNRWSLTVYDSRPHKMTMHELLRLIIKHAYVPVRSSIGPVYVYKPPLPLKPDPTPALAAAWISGDHYAVYVGGRGVDLGDIFQTVGKQYPSTMPAVEPIDKTAWGRREAQMMVERLRESSGRGSQAARDRFAMDFQRCYRFIHIPGMTDPTVGRRSDAKEQLALYHSIESWWEKNREQTEWSDALGKLTAKGDLAAEQEPDRPDQLPATPLNER